MSNTSNNNALPAGFVAQAQAQGVVSQQGYFVQDDFEFQLDHMSDRSIKALEEAIAGQPTHPTAVALKAVLTDSLPHFTPFVGA